MEIQRFSPPEPMSAYVCLCLPPDAPWAASGCIQPPSGLLPRPFQASKTSGNILKINDFPLRCLCLPLHASACRQMAHALPPACSWHDSGLPPACLRSHFKHQQTIQNILKIIEFRIWRVCLPLPAPACIQIALWLLPACSWYALSLLPGMPAPCSRTSCGA